MQHIAPFGVEETHGILGRPGVKVRACSDGRSWTSLYASVQEESPFHGVFRSIKDHLLVLHRDGPVRVENAYDSKGGSLLVPAGGIHMVSPGVEFGVRLAGTLETVHVYLRRAVLEEVALEMIDGDPAKIEIPSGIVDSDPVLRALLEAAASAVETDGAGSSIFADFIARAIAVQLIQAHARVSLRATKTRATNGGWLSASVTRAIDYMNAHIDEAISLNDIAEATNRSPSHIARMFRSELGEPPHRYLINLRVEKARRLLEKTNISIAEVAYDCGFAHQEHLTRRFRRHFNTTPAAYRRENRKHIHR